MRFLTSTAAQQLDRDLLSVGGFSIDQLMELAGLSCAEAFYHSYPPGARQQVLIACGPGNQGGDGLVAARHLHHFGYTPQVWYPKRNKAPLFDVCNTNQATRDATREPWDRVCCRRGACDQAQPY